MPPNVVITLVAIAVGALVVFGNVILVAKLYRRVEQGQALIITTSKQPPVVSFTGRIVFPVIHAAEILDISLKTFVVTRRGNEVVEIIGTDLNGFVLDDVAIGRFERTPE